ncbi:MAG: hypothetical protein QGH66_05420 [Dehalococcoidia bacterium]|nr:hypothetical protein [Dehalococcoidia bacterium]
MIDQLGQAVAAHPPDCPVIEQLGGESCVKCHLVYPLAASAKSRWTTLIDAFK